MTDERLVPIEFGSHDVAYDGTETRTRVVMAGAGSLIALIDAVQRGRAISWVGHVLVEFDNHLVPPGPVTMVLDEDDLKALFAVRDALLKGNEMDHYHGEQDASPEQLGEDKQVAVAVAEDPVREAARKLIKDGWAAYEIRTYTAEGQQLILALRDALTKPAPPSLTEDERKLVFAHLPNRIHFPSANEILKSAREKLS